MQLTGHSLGGGLAAAAAIVNSPNLGPNQLNATTFNAAGVHRFTVERYGNFNLSTASNLVTSFRVDIDPLSTSQNTGWSNPFSGMSWIPGAVGWIMPDGVGTDYWLPSAPGTGLNQHGMVAISAAISQALAAAQKKQNAQ